MLHALPGALAIPAAWAVSRIRVRGRELPLAVIGAALAIPIVVTRPVLAPRQAALVAATRDVPRRVATLPPRSILITGQPCAALPMFRTLARLDRPESPLADHETICAGWAWPRDLARRLDEPLASGRTIVADLRPGAWTPSQAAERRELDAWLEAHSSATVALVAWR
jgi:hypothetical protein